MSQDLIATYLLETADDPRAAARLLAGEQSAGTFVPVPGETPELLARHGAEVLEVLPVGEVASPSLPGARAARPGQAYQQVRVRVRYPVANTEACLVNTWTQVAGNLFELHPFSGAKLVAVEFPEIYAQRYRGPQFGIAGTRRLTGIDRGPLLGTIIKPSVGLSPEDTAALVDQLCAAGIDFIKDDELIASPGYSPVEARARAILPVIERHAQRTGRRVMYAFNLSGELDAMRRRHDTLRELGATCVMFNLIAVGLAAGAAFCRHSELAVHGHRSGWGMYDRHPLIGMSYPAFAAFWRLAGVDHLHCNALRNKFCESDASVIASARSLGAPLHGCAPVMPVFSSGQTPRHAPETRAALGGEDVIHLAGGGIMAHPNGPAGGIRALRAAWEAAASGESLEQRAARDADLRLSLEQFPG